MAKYTKKSKRRIRKYYAQAVGHHLVSHGVPFKIGFFCALKENKLITKSELEELLRLISDSQRNAEFLVGTDDADEEPEVDDDSEE